MAVTQDRLADSDFPPIHSPELISPPSIQVQPSTEADCTTLPNLKAPEETRKSSNLTLPLESQSSLSHLTYDINAHFAEKQRSNVDCQDSMSVVRKLSNKLSLSPGGRKPSCESEIRSKISETEDSLVTFLPRVVISSDDNLDECDSDIGSGDDHDNESERRTQIMKRSLLWIRKELLDLRKKDHIIGQQFMIIRNEIQRLRLLQTVEQHRNMLDDIASDAQEEKAYAASSMCEPLGLMQYGQVAPSLLRDVGLTKRDISDRRFSLG